MTAPASSKLKKKKKTTRKVAKRHTRVPLKLTYVDPRADATEIDTNTSSVSSSFWDHYTPVLSPATTGTSYLKGEDPLSFFATSQNTSPLPTTEVDTTLVPEPTAPTAVWKRGGTIIYRPVWKEANFLTASRDAIAVFLSGYASTRRVHVNYQRNHVSVNVTPEADPSQLLRVQMASFIRVKKAGPELTSLRDVPLQVPQTASHWARLLFLLGETTARATTRLLICVQLPLLEDAQKCCLAKRFPVLVVQSYSAPRCDSGGTFLVTMNGVPLTQSAQRSSVGGVCSRPADGSLSRAPPRAEVTTLG
ncbi:hypothetical protein MRX96_042183 [Rhipicephalus microplus]